MVYSPVDFAAYSRATGQPYPETPEERAAMANDVRQFREQQLRRDEGPGLLQSAAVGAGILGGLVGAGLAGRKLLGRRGKDPRMQSGQTPGKSGIQQVDLSVARVSDKEAVPLQESGAYVPPSKKVQTLVDVQETSEPQVRYQSNDATDSSSDQMDSFVERSVQRDTDSVRLGKGDFLTFSEQATAIAKEAKAQSFLSSLLSSRGALSVYDLTGDPMDLPAVRNMSAKQRKAVFGTSRPPRGLLSDTDFISEREKEFLNRPRESGFGESNAQDALDEFIQARRDREAMQSSVQLEVADRLNAAASLGDTPYEQDLKKLLLDPTVSTDFVKNLLGSTVAERRGRVGTNLTQEVTEGARASMVDKDPEMAARMVQFDEDVVLVDDRDPFVGAALGQDYDSYGGEGIASAEGPGTMVDTESFRERTNKGTTQVPGMVMEAGEGSSTRMERFADRQSPVRTTEEGDPSRGYTFAGGRFRLEGEGVREGGRISSSDINVEGSKIAGNFETPVDVVNVINKTTGTPLVDPSSDFITTQPNARYRNTDEQLVRGSDGNMYIIKSRIVDPELESPLMGKRATKTSMPGGKEPRNVFMKNTPSVPVKLNRAELEMYAQDASDAYFNDPSAKKTYLEKYNPDLLTEGVASGKTLSEIGDPSTYNNFVINSVQGALRKNKGVNLDILTLQQNKNGINYYPTEAHAFITNLLKTTRTTPLYGVPAALDEAGKVQMQNVKRGNTLFREPVPAQTSKGELYESAAIPGQYEARGSTGVDPMQVGDDYEGKIAYYTPRVQTAPQVIKDKRTGQVLSASPSATGSQGQVVTGVTEGPKGTRQPQMGVAPQLQTKRQISFGNVGPQLAGLRQQMETTPEGRRAPYLSNVGGDLIANTKRPYTGYAYAAYGSIYNPLPEGTVATSKMNLPVTSPQQQLNRSEIGEAAQRIRGTGAVLNAPEMTESDYINRYGLGQRAMNRAVAILANRPVGYTPPSTQLPTTYTYYPPKI